MTDFRLKAVIRRLAQEQTPVAASEPSESIIRTGDDVRRRDFLLQKSQKFFGRLFTEVFGKRYLNQHVDAHIRKNIAAEIFTANHERGIFGRDDAQRVIREGKNNRSAADFFSNVESMTDNARMTEMNAVEHAERDDGTWIFFRQARNFLDNLQDESLISFCASWIFWASAWRWRVCFSFSVPVPFAYR